MAARFICCSFRSLQKLFIVLGEQLPESRHLCFSSFGTWVSIQDTCRSMLFLAVEVVEVLQVSTIIEVEHWLVIGVYLPLAWPEILRVKLLGPSFIGFFVIISGVASNCTPRMS